MVMMMTERGPREVAGLVSHLHRRRRNYPPVGQSAAEKREISGRLDAVANV